MGIFKKVLIVIVPTLIVASTVFGQTSGKTIGTRLDENGRPYLVLETPAKKPIRTWTDNTGSFKVDARFVSEDKGVVTLEKEDGSQFEIELLKLGPPDQEVIAKMKKGVGENPFKQKTPEGAKGTPAKAPPSSGKTIGTRRDENGVPQLVWITPPENRIRTWTDGTGNFKVDARFVSEEKGVVTLGKEDGSQLEIELLKLSSADQAFVAQMKKGVGENPFKQKTPTGAKETPVKPPSSIEPKNANPEESKALDPQKEVITSAIGIKMVRIPAGSFRMGSEFPSEPMRAFNEFSHTVSITKPFFIGQHEVTVAQYKESCKNSNHICESQRNAEGGWGWTGSSFEQRRGFTPDVWGYSANTNSTVVNVSWNDATAFCAWLSRTEGRKYRLPTEAEWEYACRAGTKTTYYSGWEGTTLQNFANLRDHAPVVTAKLPFEGHVPWDDGYPFTAPVGSFKPNEFGLFDMHGNVWEWCQDWQTDDGTKLEETDPKGPQNGEFKIIRGGAWNDFPDQCRSARRIGNAPINCLFNIGFRVACDE